MFLLYGPPGLGKTTLASIIAQELEVPFTQTSGPVMQKKLDLSGLLSTIQPRQVFFIDEIHRLAARRGRDALFRARRFPSGYSDRHRSRRANAFDAASEIHGDRRDHAAGTRQRTDAQPLRSGVCG